MKPFSELTFHGRLRRLHRVAKAAVERYPIDVTGLSLAGCATNLIYRVRTRDGATHALRVASPGWRTLTDLRSEAMWLEAIARDTDIVAPRITRAADGSSVVTCRIDGVPKGRHCTLMSWLPGVTMGHRLSAPNLAKLGALFGHMHIHGAAWQPPEGFTTRTFDRFLSRGEPDVLFADEHRDAHTPRTLRVIHHMRDQVDAAYAGLDPADRRVIHCDLWHDNVKVHLGVLQPFDFEDTVWGYRLHDIAMAMLDLYEEGDPDRYPELLAAFRRGYEPLLAWPEGDMTALQIGRILWRINWVARFQPQHLAAILERDTAMFERYLETGLLLHPASPSGR